MMKIVIVLCSLATFAIAVPVHQENVFESSLSNQALSIKRQRKSAFPDTPGLFTEHGIEKIPIHNSKKSSQSTSVEAKSFRRPIIIKRKLGYHVYRDSDEEMAYAEPGEKCREQVKFKLCDHEPVSSSKNGFNSPTFKCFNNQNTHNEMENSIKMAKEAVEHLQKDLKRMEKFSPKIANPHIEDIESNTGLHHDIEIAREALEHIEHNFESKNLELNKANELQISKSQDKERLTRWREAIENIHKNFEIVKNIEDAFKSDNHFSLFRSDSGKTVELEKSDHLEDLNDYLENNKEVNNEDEILKSASNKDGNAHLTPKSENLDDIGKNMGNDMFVSPTENKEEKLRLHSDSLKSDNNNKDSFLRSDVSEIESMKHVSNAPKESIEYLPKKSLSEVPNYSKHEKSVKDDYELLPKGSSSSSDSLENNLQIEEQKRIDKSEQNMKTAFLERDNRNLLIRMKPVKEILENKEDQEKAATSNEENINAYENLIKSKNENSPLERLTLLPSTNIEKTSSNIENFKDTETGEEEKLYSVKYNNKIIANEENESKSYNTNMRLSNDQLEKTDQLFATKYVNIDQDVSQTPHSFSLKEKERNALGGEENVQNEYKTHHTIKENHEFYDSLKDLDKEVNDKAQNLKRTDEYNNMKSSEVQDEKIDSQMIQNQEQNKFSFLNDDSVKKVDKLELYKTVSDFSNEANINYRDFKKKIPTDKVEVTNNQQPDREEASMRASQSQNEKMHLNDNQGLQEFLPIGLDIERHAEEQTWQSSKSVPELPNDPKLSIPTEKVDIIDDQRVHNDEASMRLAESPNEKKLLDEIQAVNEPLTMVLDIESLPEEPTWELSKSVPELPNDPMVTMATRKVNIIDEHHEHKEEASMRSSESHSEKLLLNEYQEEADHASTRLDDEYFSNDAKTQFFKSVPELQPYLIASLLTDKVDINQHSHEEEASMRLSENHNEKTQSNEYQELREPLTLDIERHTDRDPSTWQSSKSVSELLYDPIVSMPTSKVDITDDQQAHKEEESMRSSESQSEKLQLNENKQPEHAPAASFPTDKEDITNNRHLQGEEVLMRSADSQNEKNLSNENQEVYEPLPTGLDIERHQKERTWQSPKSVPELTSDSMVSMPMEKVHVNDDHHANKEEASMRSAESQSEKLELNEYQDEPKHASTKLDIENNSDGIKSPFSKSVSDQTYDPMGSMATEKVHITNDHRALKEEASMRTSESLSEKLKSNDYQAEPEHASTKLDIESSSDDIKPLFSKSVSDLTYDPMVSMATEKVDSTNDHYALKEEPSMRSSESQSEKLELNEYQDVPEDASPKLAIENSSDKKSQFLKSVSELESHSLALYPTDKVDITNNRYLIRELESMRSAEGQNEKNQEVHELRQMGLDIERHPEERTWEFSKSVPERPSNPVISMPMEKVDTPKDHYFYTGDASMRVSETQNEKLSDIQKGHEPLRMRLDMTNRPEDRKWQISKSVSELPFDSMVSMPTDKVEITYDQKPLKEENMRLSQNQIEGRQFHDSHGLQDFSPRKLVIENHPEYRTSQFYKSAPELYMTRSNIHHNNNENSYFPEEARLSQNENERRQMYFNQHLYETLSSRTADEKKLEDDSLTANTARFSYIQNPMREETNMRLSQNDNEYNEIPNPSRNLGLSNEENTEHMNDLMPPSVAQHQQLHENLNPMLRLSNERQYLSHNFKSWPEHKILPLTSQFESSNGQNVLNEYMRMNEQQSRDPEPMENQNLHNSHLMRWNTGNQHQEPSSKIFKYNSDFDHTLHKSNDLDNQQLTPYEVSKTANTLEYRSRPQLFGDHMLDDTQSSRWYQTKQNNDHFANYYKTIPEGHEEYMNPHFRNHLHRVAVNHNLNDADTLGIHDSPSNRARLHEHMQKYHQEMSSNLDSSIDPSMHMSMVEPFAKSGTEFNNMNFNHPHGTARFGAGLPIGGVNSGAVGVFPTANAGGCGIPLFLSCNPSVVSGSLARPHIGGPILRSVDENFKYYMKRDAKNVADIPDMNIQKASFPPFHGTGSTSEI